MRVVLISTYELGHQPFGLASPAAWLRRAECSVTCQDLSVQELEELPVKDADLIAFYLPMHTATRAAVPVLKRVRLLNPNGYICFYGLYAPLNAEYLLKLGAHAILGGEYESELVKLVHRLAAYKDVTGRPEASAPTVSLARQRFLVPDRTSLPRLARYAHLVTNDGMSRPVGYTEASRGCKHSCRHCPIVPVYEGRFRIVQRDVVMQDVRQQVEQGAQHITFGDPDFFNGIGHALAVVETLHREHPQLSYDVTIKVEHLLKYCRHLPTLRDTGCLFVTSAVESVDDRVLQLLDKGHTRSDFLKLVDLFRNVGLTLSPTFVTFTPWTTWEEYHNLLALLADLELVENVAPIQLAIRLLVPAGSKLLELPELREVIGDFDPSALSYRWVHPDPRMDELCHQVRKLVKDWEGRGRTRSEIFLAIRRVITGANDSQAMVVPEITLIPPRTSVPYLNEPWYC